MVQFYTSKPDTKIDRPVKELRTFTKTKNLEPGEEILVALKIHSSELNYWSEENSKWELEEGKYSLLVGTSSRDIKLAGEMEIVKYPEP